jgi:hypothetical protein
MKKSICLLLCISLLVACGKESLDDNRLDDADFYETESQITYTIGSSTYTYKTSNPADITTYFNNSHSNFTETVIKATPNSLPKLEFAFNGTQAGNYSITSFTENSLPSTIQLNNADVKVTTYGLTGYYVKGSFSGNLKDASTGVLIPITGTFKVKR